tara:strand:+ start:175 stop:603 length:429 start_codon:yes stop_codon:yes gene_type:complete
MAKSKPSPLIQKILRVLAGLLFTITGLAKLGILPSGVNRPEAFTPEGWAFISVLDAGGYMFPVVGIISLVCGIAFLMNRYTALAAILLLPLTVNFALFHIFLGFPLDSISHFFRELVAYAFFALNLYLVYHERDKYTALVKA